MFASPRFGLPGRLACALLLTSIVAGLVVGPGCSKALADRTPALTILYTGAIVGKAEPCGCFTGDFGGLVRIAGFVNEVRAKAPNSVYFDLGDLLHEGHRVGHHMSQQFPLKSSMMMDALEKMGCDAMVPGDYDFAAGREVVEQLDNETDFPLVLANVVDAETGELVFDESAIIEAGDWKIGVFGLIAENLNDPTTGEPDLVIPVAKRFAAEGLRVLDPVEVASDLVPRLREQCDIVIALGHLGQEGSQAVATQVEGIDILLAAHITKRTLASERIESTGTQICFIKVKGSRVGHLEIYGDPTANDIVDRSNLTELENNLFENQRELEEIDARLDVKRDVEDVQGRIEVKNRIIGIRDAMNRAGEIDGENLLENYLAIIDKHITPDAYTDELMLAYHRETREYWLAQRAGRRVPGNKDTGKGDYIGYEACITCHPQQYEFWNTTGHSRAYATLEATYQELDVECFPCHTASWLKPRGFTNPLGAQRFGFTNVQCESCHGAGSFHSLGGVNSVVPGSIERGASAQTCTQCHNKDHDPSFSYYEKIDMVACPKTPPGDPHLARILESSESSVRAQIEDGNLGMRPVLARVLIQLNRHEEAIEVLEAFVYDEEAAVSGRMFLAMSYFETQQYADAIKVADMLIEELPDHADAFVIKGRSLFELGRTNDALNFLQDAVSTHPTRLELLRLFAKGLREHIGDDKLLEWMRKHPELYPAAGPYMMKLSLEPTFSDLFLEETGETEDGGE